LIIKAAVSFVGTAAFLFAGPRVKGWMVRKEENSGLGDKLEYRNSKSETNSKFELSNVLNLRKRRKKNGFEEIDEFGDCAGSSGNCKWCDL
jgi:hypothetical protein